MHFMLFLDRSSHTSKCLSVLTTATTTAIRSIFTVTILFSILIVSPAPVVQGRVIGTSSSSSSSPPSSRYYHPEELLIVEEFKRRILEHMGLTAPPTVHANFRNITQVRDRFRHKINDFAQRMEQNENRHRDFIRGRDQTKTIYRSKRLRLQLKSPNEIFKVPIARNYSSSSMASSPTVIVPFSAPLSQAHESAADAAKEILKSAILRLHLKHNNKYRLRRFLTSRKSHIEIRVSLVHQQHPHPTPENRSVDSETVISPNSNTHSPPHSNTTTTTTTQSPNSILLKSFIVHPRQIPDVIELDNLKHHLPSSSFSTLHKNGIVFQVSASEIPDPEVKSFFLYPTKDAVLSTDQTSTEGAATPSNGGDESPSTSSRSLRRGSATRNHRPPRHPFSGGASFLTIHPTLEVKVLRQKRRRKSRSRRSADSLCSSNGLCCRHSVNISFADIGWDRWVLSPEGYTAYYCQGGCPTRYQAASAFSGIKSLLHGMNPNLIPAATCAAESYTSIELLHLGENNTLVESEYPGMIVTQCKCY